MASSRRKQDEKHLKILREFVSKPENRTCFDCHQKGPTYVNMTIGSFICTSCSGILRGLNPPHRVKSISMASFTSEEVEQIKSRGNQYCQAVWLGLFDGKSNIFPDTKDEHKIRDFMISKYEKKRFYVDPAVALKNGNSSQAKSESSSSASTPGSDNRSLGSAPPNSVASVSRPIANVQNSGSSPSLNGLNHGSNLKLSPSVDLLSRLGNNSTTTAPKTQQQTSHKDPFSGPVSSQGTTQGFANFENANIFSSASISKPPSNPPRLPFSSNPLTPLTTSSSSSSSAPKSVSTTSHNTSTAALGANSSAPLGVCEDRYAALKDLDEAFKVQKEVDKPSGNNSVMFGSPPTGNSQPPPANPLFGTSPISSSGGNFYPNSSMSNQGWNATFPTAVNPFSGNGSSNANMGSPWPNSSNFGSLSTQVQPQVNPFAGGADPNFNSQFVPAFGAAPANNTNSNLSGFGTSTSVQNGSSNNLSTNPWGSSSPPNPFSAPPQVVPSSGSSYNPFL